MTRSWPARLFARHGYAGTSIRAIAREVGLSESALYAHFGSKRSIFEAVLARLGPQSAATVLRASDQGMLETEPAGWSPVRSRGHSATWLFERWIAAGWIDPGLGEPADLA